jgi:hypothetical protein
VCKWHACARPTLTLSLRFQLQFCAADSAPPPPLQAACTPKELKELVTQTPGLAVHAPDDQMVVSEADAAEMAATRLKRRVHDIIKQAAQNHPATSTTSKHLHFEFYRQPKQVGTDEAWSPSVAP